MDMENPTTQEIVKSLDVNEKLRPVGSESGEEIQLQPTRSLSADEVREKTERKGSMPQGRKASRASAKEEDNDERRRRKSSKR